MAVFVPGYTKVTQSPGGIWWGIDSSGQWKMLYDPNDPHDSVLKSAPISTPISSPIPGGTSGGGGATGTWGEPEPIPGPIEVQPISGGTSGFTGGFIGGVGGNKTLPETSPVTGHNIIGPASEAQAAAREKLEATNKQIEDINKRAAALSQKQADFNKKWFKYIDITKNEFVGGTSEFAAYQQEADSLKAEIEQFNQESSSAAEKQKKIASAFFIEVGKGELMLKDDYNNLTPKMQELVKKEGTTAISTEKLTPQQKFEKYKEWGLVGRNDHYAGVDPETKEPTYITITDSEIEKRRKDFITTTSAGDILTPQKQAAILAAGLTPPARTWSADKKKWLSKWLDSLPEDSKAILLANYQPMTTGQLWKQVAEQMPVYGTIKSVEKSGWKSGYTWASIAGDVLIFSPVIGKALGLATAPVTNYLPRIGSVPIGAIKVGGREIIVKRLIALPSKNAVRDFEKLKAKVSKDWLEFQKKLPTATWKEGETLLDDSIIKQLSGLPYKQTTAVENPFTRFTEIETAIEGQRYPSQWGYVTKRSPSISTYTTPVDEVLANPSDIPGLSSIIFGEGGYGTTGKMSKVAYEAEKTRARILSLLEDRPWEISPKVKTAVKTELKNEAATKEKFKTITEKKSEYRPSKETERLENIRQYGPRKKVFTGTGFVIAAAPYKVIIISLATKGGKSVPATIAIPDIVTKTVPDIRKLIEDATTKDSVVSAAALQAVQVALQRLTTTDIVNMSDTQLKNMMDNQVNVSLVNQIELAPSTVTKTELQAKTETIVNIATKLATEIATKVRDKLRLSPILILTSDDRKGGKSTAGVLHPDGTVTFRTGKLHKKVWHVIEPPYRRGNYTIEVSDTPPRNATVTTANKVAETIQLLGGKLDKDLVIDIGAFDYHIFKTTVDKKPRSRFTRDIHGKTKHELSAKEAKVIVSGLR